MDVDGPAVSDPPHLSPISDASTDPMSLDHIVGGHGPGMTPTWQIRDRIPNHKQQHTTDGMGWGADGVRMGWDGPHQHHSNYPARAPAAHTPKMRTFA